MPRYLLALAALACAVSIAAGAFGAHALRARLDPRALELWETAARYLMYGGLGAVLAAAVALQAPGARGFEVSAGVLLAGAAVFSGTVFALALGGPRWLGAVTPLGGGLMIAGFLHFAYSALRL